MLGTWDGIDDATGMADRSFASLAPGDWVGSLSTVDGSERDTMVLQGEPEAAPEEGFAPPVTCGDAVQGVEDRHRRWLVH